MKTKRSSVNWGKGLSILTLFALVMVLAPNVLRADAIANVQPILVQIAKDNPDSIVQVIVQKATRNHSVEEIAGRLGTITKDLHIINAFAAELRAKDALQLAAATGVRWVSLDTPMLRSSGPDGIVDTGALLNAYNLAIGADKLWAEGYQGSSVTVAVVDSGVASANNDVKTRVIASVKLNNNTRSAGDKYGHGTHVAGIVGGSGVQSKGDYIGIAPKVKLVNVKVSDDQGMATESDVVGGLQWVYDNKDAYGIRIVNLSLNGTLAQSYNVDPLDAAVEILWINRIVVVVSAGNQGTSGVDYPPANDPFVITVGAFDDRGTASTNDDVLASYSAFGVTTDGFAKPDLVAPGSNIISLLAATSETLAKAHPTNLVNNQYFRMSGTSMASAVTAGAVALLLQAEPNLNPDQVKYRLKLTARSFDGGSGVGAGGLDIHAAAHGTSAKTANTGLLLSQMLFTGTSPANWGSASWGSANWGSASWGSASWGSASWGSASWGSDYWGD